jgi:hypothetical protein
MVHEFEELFIRRATMAGDETLPFERDQPYGTSHRHAPVKFTGHKTVGLCGADDVPFGSLERVEADGSVVVAWLGSVLYAGTASAGSAVVGDGAGGVKNATGAGRGIAGSSEGGRVVVFQ